MHTDLPSVLGLHVSAVLSSLQKAVPVPQALHYGLDPAEQAVWTEGREC